MITSQKGVSTSKDVLHLRDQFPSDTSGKLHASGRARGDPYRHVASVRHGLGHRGWCEKEEKWIGGLTLLNDLSNENLGKASNNLGNGLGDLLASCLLDDLFGEGK